MWIWNFLLLALAKLVSGCPSPSPQTTTLLPDLNRGKGIIFRNDFADYIANRCKPLPECFEGNFLRRFGAVGLGIDAIRGSKRG